MNEQGIRARGGRARIDRGRRAALLGIGAIGAVGLTGCVLQARLPDAAAQARYTLLGELHDNPALHRLRLEWLRAMTAKIPRVLAMEQFDSSMQPGLDAARVRIDERIAARLRGPEVAGAAGGAGSPPIPDDETWLREQARELAEAAGFSFTGWDWALYEPAVALALRRRLPLVAANLSAREASAIARGGGARDDRPPGWTDADAAVMADAIRDGHCGLLPERSIAAMVRAQLARDRTMARAMVDARRRTGLPVVLLAGNGHVRTDIGVPRHLAALDPGAASFATGIGERGAPVDGRFDAYAAVEPVPREDPCEALRRRFGGRA